MSGRTIKSGSVDQYCEVKVWTTSDGVPNTTLVYNTAALAIWYQIGNAAAVEVVVGGSPAPATMSAGGAHADWGIYHIAQGRYKIGLADAVVSAAANVTVWIVFTDCDSAPCEIDVVGYDKTDAAALGLTDIALIETSTTTTIPDLIGGIGSSGGAALPVECNGDNAAGAIIDGVTILGTETLTYAATEANDAIYHDITGTATALDWVYRFSLGGGYVAASVKFKGYVNSSNDSMTVQAWNGSTWETRFVLDGTNGSTDVVQTITLLSKHTTSLGYVYIRFVTSGGTNPSLHVNELNVLKVNTSRSVGYIDGVSVDTLNGIAGTEPYTNGTGDKPALTWADAQTIAAGVGISHYHISNGSTITLDQATDNTEIKGDEFTLNFGGQSVNNTSVSNGLVYTGTFTGYPHLLHSGISGITGPGAKIGWGAIRGAVISNDGGTSNRWVLHNCWGVDRTTSAFDFGEETATAQIVYITEFHGVITIKNMNTEGDVLYFTGASDVIIDASCTEGTISFQGAIRLMNNGTGQTIVYDDLVTDVDAVLVDTGTTIPALLPANLATLSITTGNIAGTVGGIAGTIQTLDALDTAQDTQHGATQDRLGYTIAALAGASSDAGTAAETYAITLGADTYTIDHSGLDSTGNRGTATLTKT